MLLLLINNVPQIFNVDGDNTISPAQAGVVVSGTGLSLGTSARIRYGTNTLTMNSFSPGVSPIFTVPSFSPYLSSGMPFGTVNFDILRAV
jgi:hypothetical protein